jgi:hypothetical protein
MSTETPRDDVKGVQERPPGRQGEPEREERPAKRDGAEIEPERKHAMDAPSHHSDDPWYQPESGSLGPD